jgi:hypothetical protein
MVSVFVVIVMAVALAGLTVGLGRAITKDIRQAARFRERLGARLGELRLGRVLDRFAIDPRAYVHDLAVTAVEMQMARCRGCACVDLCDAALRRNAAPSELAFCPNYPALAVLAR